MFDDKFNEVFNNFRETNNKAGNKTEAQTETKSHKVVKKVEPDGSIETKADTQSSISEKEPKKVTLNPTIYENAANAKEDLEKARTKRKDITKEYTEELKSKRVDAKKNKYGRESEDITNLMGSDTDLYLSGIIDNKMLFDANGKRTSKLTGKELRRVAKKKDEYIFSDDGSEATLFDYQQWKEGNREGDKVEGKSFTNSTLQKALQNIAFKKTLRDFAESDLSKEEKDLIVSKFKNKKLKQLAEEVFTDEEGWTGIEQTFIDKLYTPIIEKGEQGTQNRQIFADAWKLAETTAIRDITQALQGLNVNTAKETSKHWNDLVRKEDALKEEQLKELEGPTHRETTVYYHEGDKFPYGFAVAHEGANAAYMGRVETDDSGKKFFRVYKADSQTEDVKKAAKEEWGGRFGNKGAKWLASHIADTYRDPVFNLPINGDEDISEAVQAAAATFEMDTGQMEGKYKNQRKKISKATDDWLGDTYIGSTFPDYVSKEFGEDVTDKKHFTKDRLKKRLEQLEEYGLVVDRDTHKIVPLGSTENDYLSHIRMKEKMVHDLHASVPFSERPGYEQQADGTWLKVYKPDNTMSKMNRHKGDLNLKRNYGAGSTVKDRKTGKYYGETAQQERLKSLKEKPTSKPQGLLGTLKNRGH